LYPGTGVAFYPEQADNLENDTLLVPKFTQIDQIMINAVDSSKVTTAQMEVTALLRDRHRLKEDEDNDFWIRNTAAFMQTLSSTTTLMSNLLLVVALISLIVGGVGIMNIMLVSVTERTREIGLRMAVGARSRDILQQFLTESIILCAAGGITGIILGHGAALLVNLYLKWPVESSPAVVAAAFLVSAAVGIIFGFYPAWKASRLDPIEALRYE
jgi:ABC-type antimicrobial peptide transport system permease subunit